MGSPTGRIPRAAAISGLLLVGIAFLALTLRGEFEGAAGPAGSARSREDRSVGELEERSPTGRILVRAVGAAVPRIVSCALNGKTSSIESAIRTGGHFTVTIPSAREGDAFTLSAAGFFPVDGQLDDHLGAEVELLSHAVLEVLGPKRAQGGIFLLMTPSAGGESRRREAIPCRFQPLRAGTFELGVYRAASGQRLARFPIELGWGETRRLNLEGIPPTLALQGSVWAGAGDPLSGATIEAWFLDPAQDLVANAGQTTSAEAGNFSLALVAGRYRIVARMSGFQPATREFEISGSEVAGVRFVLERAIRLSGVVRNESGETIPGAGVFLHKTSDGKGSNSEITRAGADGRFEFAEIGPGYCIDLRVFKNGFRSEAIVLGALGETREIDVVLEKDVPLEVVVVDADTGRSVHSARVAIEMKVGGRVVGGAARIERRSAGRWLVHGLPGDRVVLRVDAPAYRAWREEVDPSQAGSCRVELESVPGIDLHGIVRDVAGRPVPNVSVSGLGHTVRCSARARTDAQGRFVLRGLTPDKLYEVDANKYLHKLVSRTVYFEPGPGKIIELTLERAARLKGRLLIDEGELPREVRLRVDRLSDSSGRSIPATTAQPSMPVRGSNGAFSLGHLIPGQYVVTICSRWILPLQLTGIRLEAGETTDLGVIHIRRGRGVRLTLADRVGRPVAPCVVVALDESGGVWSYGYADAEGQVPMLGRFPTDKYLMVGLAGSAPAIDLGTVSVSGSQDIEEHRVIREPGRLRVILRDDNGTPRPGVSIEVRGDGRGPMSSILVCGLVDGVRWKSVALSMGNGRDEHGNVAGSRALRSDRQGVVDIGPLDPGNYVIMVRGEVRRVSVASGADLTEIVTVRR
jgi:Carboxypeptidase regulatory-like domain